MSQPEFHIVRAAQVRRSLTQPGDVRGEVAFQNDINALLARFDEVKVPWKALGTLAQTIPPSIVADDTPVPTPVPARPQPRLKRIDITFPRLRVVEGGGLGAPTMDLLPVAPAPVVAPRIAIETTPPPRVVPVPGRNAVSRTPRRR
jgi:hypothetical protein